jgi:LytS/YehU family sensor histidine kinase
VSHIDIFFTKKNDVLYFHCANSKEHNHHPVKDHKGIGIDNVRRRLALHYDKRHELQIAKEDYLYKVDLNLQL